MVGFEQEKTTRGISCIGAGHLSKALRHLYYLVYPASYAVGSELHYSMVESLKLSYLFNDEVSRECMQARVNGPTQG